MTWRRIVSGLMSYARVIHDSHAYMTLLYRLHTTLEYMTRLCTIDAVLLNIVMFTNADRGAHNSESTLNQRGAWV